MKGIVEGDDLVLITGWVADFADLTGELDGRFVGLAAGVADKHLGCALHCA